MRTATVDTVSLMRALCDCCVGWRDRWDGVGIALAAASDPAMFIGHMRAHAVRTGHARGPARLGMTLDLFNILPTVLTVPSTSTSGILKQVPVQRP